MNKEAVISFFDNYAASWDSNIKRNEAVISKILDLAGIEKGKSVLDVACGTGVLLGDYFKRAASSVTAIDISSKMVEIAQKKYPKAQIICGDAQTFAFEKDFDCIVIYNAFPHFTDEGKLFENLSKHLKSGARLTIAHGASREEIIKCHQGAANHISKELVTAEELKEKMNEYICVDSVISDEEMYLVSGVKR